MVLEILCTSLWCAEAHLGDFRTSMVERLAKKIKDLAVNYSCKNAL